MFGDIRGHGDGKSRLLLSDGILDRVCAYSGSRLFVNPGRGAGNIPIQRLVCGYSVCHSVYTPKELLFVWIYCQAPTLISRVGSWTIYTAFTPLYLVGATYNWPELSSPSSKFEWTPPVATSSFCLFPFVCFSLDAETAKMDLFQLAFVLPQTGPPYKIHTSPYLSTMHSLQLLPSSSPLASSLSLVE